MPPALGGPAQGTTHVFAVRPGRVTDDTKKYTTRRPHRKTKLGCQTCKVRRVKCDEAKPSCNRCVRAKSTCVYNGETGTPTALPAPNMLALQRLPNTLSRTPPEPCLMRHYDIVTSLPMDTITFSNILAGERSSQYRALVMDQAKKHEHLMHSMLAVSALHLSHHGNHTHRRTGLAHLQLALPKFRESMAGPISPQESPHILYSAMLITLYYFCIQSRDLTDSWVFSSAPDRLNWLNVLQGLHPLFDTTRQHHTHSFMTPVFEIVNVSPAADESVPLALVQLCGITAAATPADLERNPYVLPIQSLNAIMPLERNVPNVLKYLVFFAAFRKDFVELIGRHDHRTLLIVSYGFALMCNVELWWTQPRARRDCWAICSYLDTHGDESVRALLAFPAKACGYSNLAVQQRAVVVGS